MATTPAQDKMANAIRFLAVDAVEKANSGHPGLPMGAADIATVLFRDVLKFDAADPHWPDRDRFVLSAGHGSMLLYALLYLTGTGGDKGLTIDDLKQFRQVGSKTPGHPEYGHTIGVETTTGPLGQGLATAVGMAIAERMMAAHFPTVVDHHTYVLASDGDLMEGVSHEAIAIAGHLKLSKLIVFWDDNDISIDGKVSVLNDNVDQVERFKAAGWNACPIDGHDVAAILKAAREAPEIRPADPDRLQDDDRLRRADQGGHATRRTARRLGAAESRRRAQEPQLALRAVRRAGRYPCRLARRRRARRGRRDAGGAGCPSSIPTRRAEFERRIRGDLPKGLDARHRRLQAQARRGGAGDRDPQGGRGGAQRDRAGRAGTRHRLGRPHALEQHQGRGDGGDHARRFLRALHPLGHPRARHGGGLQRPRRAWRVHPLGRVASSPSPTIAGRRCGSRR